MGSGPGAVGAFAGTQLAILASATENGEADAKRKVREAGDIAPLVGLLRSAAQDRVQSVMFAFSILRTDCPENAVEAYDTVPDGKLDEFLKTLS